MEKPRSNDPLHGQTLQMILENLVAEFGFDFLAENINVNCFKNNPTIKSSLSFLRKTPWARSKVETLYVTMIKKKQGRC